MKTEIERLSWPRGHKYSVEDACHSFDSFSADYFHFYQHTTVHTPLIEEYEHLVRVLLLLTHAEIPVPLKNDW